MYTAYSNARSSTVPVRLDWLHVGKAGLAVIVVVAVVVV